MRESGVDTSWVWIGLVVILLVILAARPLILRWSGRVNAVIAGRKDARENGMDSLVNLRTGEVIEPGSRKFERAAEKARIVFREEE